MFSDQIILTISFHAVILEVPGQSKEDLAVEIDEDVLS
jgi:HSP20 family molecular chaperone IbpA